MKKKSKHALTPKLRFPEFRGEPGWEEEPLSDFLTESRILGSKGNVAKKITVKLWGNGVFEKNEAVQGSIHTQYFRRMAGQFIYSKLDFLNQAFGIIPLALDNFESTVDLPCFDIADGLNPVFLLEYVKRKDFYERLGETADGSRKAKRIHAETFLSFPIALPAPAEQHRIADCLSSLDDLMSAEARRLDALRTHKKGLMQLLFPHEGETTPRLRFPEFRGKGKWERHTFDEFVIKAFYGTSKSTSTKGRYPVLRMGNMVDGGINLSNLVYIDLDTDAFESLKLINGDILLNRTNSLDLVGKISLFRLQEDFITASYIVTYRLERTRIDPAFCNYMLNSPLYQMKIKALAKPSVSQANINPTTFRKKMIIAVPTLSEQQKIADCLTSLDTQIEAQAAKIESLKQHKRGLMQQLFPVAEGA